MPPYGLYSLANTPEELLSTGYGQDHLYDYDPAFGELRTVQRYQPAPFTGARPFQTMYDIAPYTPNGTDLGFNADLYDPSFGGVSGYKDVGGNQNQDTNIMQQAPSFNLDLSSLPANMGVANEEDVEQEFLPDQKPSGIEKLFEFLGKLPTPFNLARRGLGSLRGLNDRMQNSDFGRSKTLVDYLDARKYGGIDARDRAAQQNMREARAIQTQVDRRGDSTSRVADRNRSSVTRSSAARSRGVGGGGYTASDSNRESYRGR